MNNVDIQVGDVVAVCAQAYRGTLVCNLLAQLQSNLDGAKSKPSDSAFAGHRTVVFHQDRLHDASVLPNFPYTAMELLLHSHQYRVTVIILVDRLFLPIVQHMADVLVVHDDCWECVETVATENHCPIYATPDENNVTIFDQRREDLAIATY